MTSSENQASIKLLVIPSKITLATCFKKSSLATVYPEEPDTRPKRADWIIDQPTSFMLVECKTKRMTIGARTIIQDDEELLRQLTKIGEAVVQSYQAFDAYKNGSYHPQQFPYSPAKQPFICVVTLEDWYLLGPQLLKLREIVRNRLLEVGLDPALMEQAPFVICSITGMEEFAYLMKTNDVADAVRRYWGDPEKSSWAFISYLTDRFKDELKTYQYVFSDEIAGVFTVTVPPQ